MRGGCLRREWGVQMCAGRLGRLTEKVTFRARCEDGEGAGI